MSMYDKNHYNKKINKSDCLFKDKYIYIYIGRGDLMWSQIIAFLQSKF